MIFKAILKKIKIKNALFAISAFALLIVVSLSFALISGNSLSAAVVRTNQNTATSAADTLRVPEQFPTIQAGIDAAKDGQIVEVNDGTYTGEGNKNLNYNGKAITVRSKNGPGKTIIDCENEDRGFVFENSEGNDSVLDGFTIENGYINSGIAGSIYITQASPIINNCVIQNNYAQNGGSGIYCEDNCNAKIINTIFQNNKNMSSGGAIAIMYNSNPLIENCEIINNESAQGGGIFIYMNSLPTIKNSNISNNVAIGTSNKLGGGAISINEKSDPIIENCIISQNISQNAGGGIGSFYSSSFSLMNSEVFENRSIYGGAIYAEGYSELHTGRLEIKNTKIYLNKANSYGTIYFSYGNPYIENSIIINNETFDAPNGRAVGIFASSCSLIEINSSIIANNYSSDSEVFEYGIWYNDTDLDIKNSIIWGHKTNSILYRDLAKITVTHSNIQGGYEGEGNIDADPQFVSSSDYHLSEGSPSIDSGSSNGAPSVDLEGNARPQGGGYDMGAYESGSAGFSSDTTPPVVTTFDIQPRDTVDSVEATWSTTDENLKKVELWRALMVDGAAKNWINVQEKNIDGTSSEDQFSNTPGIGTWWYDLRVYDQAGNKGYGPDGLIKVTKASDINDSVITSFDVQPRTTTDNVTATWSVKANASLNRAELWQAPDDNGSAGSWTKTQEENISETTSGQFTDTPGIGTWWYDLRVFDQVEDMSTSPKGSIQITVVSESGVLKVPEQYETIQAAIDAAEDGQIVEVNDGTYSGEGNINISYKGKAITIMSKNGPEKTIIDCEEDGRGIIFKNEEGNDSVLEGFTVTNCESDSNGGAIYISKSSPIINNCIIENSSAQDSGGAIYLTKSSAKLTNSIIRNNEARLNGGGLALHSESNISIVGSEITENTTSADGGGIYVYDESNLSLEESVISENTSSGFGGGGISLRGEAYATMKKCDIHNNNAAIIGGGIASSANSSFYIEESSIYSNTAKFGGAIYANGYKLEKNIEIKQSKIYLNNAERWYGGIYFYNTRLSVENTLIANNTASDSFPSVYFDNNSAVEIKNSTIANNSTTTESSTKNEYGISSYKSDLSILNSIVWGHDGGGLKAQEGSIDVTYSTIEGGYEGEGNTGNNPLFVSNEDHHLMAGSPSVDGGSSAGATSTDLEGNPRPQGNAYDMGAHESGHSRDLSIILSEPGEYSSAEGETEEYSGVESSSSSSDENTSSTECENITMTKCESIGGTNMNIDGVEGCKVAPKFTIGTGIVCPDGWERYKSFAEFEDKYINSINRDNTYKTSPAILGNGDYDYSTYCGDKTVTAKIDTSGCNFKKLPWGNYEEYATQGITCSLGFDVTIKSNGNSFYPRNYKDLEEKKEMQDEIDSICSSWNIYNSIVDGWLPPYFMDNVEPSHPDYSKLISGQRDTGPSSPYQTTTRRACEIAEKYTTADKVSDDDKVAVRIYCRDDSTSGNYKPWIFPLIKTKRVWRQLPTAIACTSIDGSATDEVTIINEKCPKTPPKTIPKHTPSTDCERIGGTDVTANGVKVCKVAPKYLDGEIICPNGWTKYKNFLEFKTPATPLKAFTYKTSPDILANAGYDYANYCGDKTVTVSENTGGSNLEKLPWKNYDENFQSREYTRGYVVNTFTNGYGKSIQPRNYKNLDDKKRMQAEIDSICSDWNSSNTQGAAKVPPYFRDRVAPSHDDYAKYIGGIFDKGPNSPYMTTTRKACDIAEKYITGDKVSDDGKVVVKLNCYDRDNDGKYEPWAQYLLKTKRTFDQRPTSIACTKD